LEFPDFQCPYCGQVEATLKNVLARHEGTVALANSATCPFRRFILLRKARQRPQGARESKASTGRIAISFFGDQGNLDRNGLIAKAAKLRLGAKQFDTCISSEKFKTQVQQDNQEGIRVGVSGTPGFFINGIFMSGAQPEAVFEKAIEDQLALKGWGKIQPALLGFLHRR
jgi:protein-disulfide isomerase